MLKREETVTGPPAISTDWLLAAWAKWTNEAVASYWSLGVEKRIFWFVAVGWTAMVPERQLA